MTENIIDAMIQKVRKRHHSQTQARQQNLKSRRDKALQRIGQAVYAHALPIGQSLKIEEKIMERLRQAQKARISKAEAMADLAEFNGDFESRVDWWELKDKQNVILWKGYVVGQRLGRFRWTARFGDLRENVSVSVDVNVRRACRGEIVASLYVEGKGVRAVGVSSGKRASIRKAVMNAYDIFTKEDGEQLGGQSWGVPQEVYNEIDSKEGCDITNLRSFTDADNSQRELEERIDGNVSSRFEGL